MRCARVGFVLLVISAKFDVSFDCVLIVFLLPIRCGLVCLLVVVVVVFFVTYDSDSSGTLWMCRGVKHSRE